MHKLESFREWLKRDELATLIEAAEKGVWDDHVVHNVLNTIGTLNPLYVPLRYFAGFLGAAAGTFPGIWHGGKKLFKGKPLEAIKELLKSQAWYGGQAGHFKSFDYDALEPDPS